MPTPGYSGKPLAEKLGIKPATNVTARGAPQDLAKWLAPLPAGAKLLTPRAREAECVLVFVTRRAQLERELPKALEQVAERGMCWICWPKQASGVATDLAEPLVQRIGLATGWVDVKVCAVSDVWSGLKFVRRVR